MDKWDRAHLDVAQRYAELSSARKLQVGCILVRDHRVLSIGYNGTPRGWDNNCEDDIDGELFTRPEVIHAEMNALMKLASSTETAALSTAYITHAPCLNCAKALYQAGVSRVVYRTGYRNQLGLNFLETCGIPVEQETEHAA